MKDELLNLTLAAKTSCWTAESKEQEQVHFLMDCCRTSGLFVST